MNFSRRFYNCTSCWQAAQKPLQLCCNRLQFAARQRRASSSSGKSPGFPEPDPPDDLWRQQPQQQPQQSQQQLQQQPLQQLQQQQQQVDAAAGADSNFQSWKYQPGMPTPRAPSLQHDFRRLPLPGWLPAWLLVYGEALLGFLQSCWEMLPQFVAPSVPEAVQRLVLVLGASLVMIGLVCTIDSGWLCLHLISTRRLPVAAA